jgi:hypothetical protein
MVRRVRDAEDVADIIGRPQRVEATEAGRAPDLCASAHCPSVARDGGAHIDDGVCGAREEQLLVLRQAQAEHAALVALDYLAPLIRVQSIDLPPSAQFPNYCLSSIPISPLPVCLQRCSCPRRQGRVSTCRASCGARGLVCGPRSGRSAESRWHPLRRHVAEEALPSMFSIYLRGMVIACCGRAGTPAAKR